MSVQPIVPWGGPSGLVVADSNSDVPAIVTAARQLRAREREQVSANLAAGHYEVAASFVWHKAMSLLKRQLATLGSQFVSELLQRPDINEYSDLTAVVSDGEALSLAKDLGMITATQAMRLAHSQEVINHFASVDSDDLLDDAEGMTPDEAIGCLRVCVQGVLGQERVAVAEDFALFRQKIEQITFSDQSPEIVRLQQSPYFFIRTAISILLSVLRTGKGVSLEHASRNATLMVPTFWHQLKQPERWQIGQAYAAEFADGNKEAVKALQAGLLAVKGFDYVPENLRSNTFTRAANLVIAAHQGMNNFYNEPAPMKELASLGSSIPGPAVASCMTAVLCVKLGNRYGVSHAAQSSADELLGNISLDRWRYYLDGRLEEDRVIVPKLAGEQTARRWIELVSPLMIDANQISSRTVRDLISATKAHNVAMIVSIGATMMRRAFS